MSDLFKLNYKYSTSHLVMPTIVGGVLVLLIVIMLIQRASRCRKEGKPFIAYFFLLNKLHFLPASLIFIFLLNVLYDESINLAALAGKADGPVIRWKPLMTSAVITVVFSVGIWYLFGTVFNITLP